MLTQIILCLNCSSDVSTPIVSVRPPVEPERQVQTKSEVQVGPGLQNHEPKPQRSFGDELRREPIPDKYVTGHSVLVLLHMTLLLLY